MSERLKGKVAIVTGAGSVPGPPDRPPIGNGRATAIVFAREGASILAVDNRIDSAEETKRMIEAEGGSCSVFQGNISKDKDCEAMAEACLKAYGQIDILHNYVGVGPRKACGILETDEEDWDLVLNVNVKGLFHTCRAVLPHMVNQGRGSILNISSVGAVLHA